VHERVHKNDREREREKERIVREKKKKGEVGGKSPWKSADGIYIHHTIYART